MIGAVGTLFGDHGVNIVSSIVGRDPGDVGDGGEHALATMVLTTDVAVPQELVDAVLGIDGFVAGQSVSL